jgi:glycerol-3-phosphate dehydrogenase (NAD(P)+)
MATAAVLGAGSWGTALAIQLANNNHAVKLWGHDADHVKVLQKNRVNKRYLAEKPFPETLSAETSYWEMTFTLPYCPDHHLQKK